MSDQSAERLSAEERERESIRRTIVEWLGRQRISLYLSKDIDHMVTGVLVFRAAARASAGPGLDVERLARAKVARFLAIEHFRAALAAARLPVVEKPEGEK